MPVSKNLKIAAIALDTTWADPEENRFNASRAIDAISKLGVDIVVLPEMFTTGFIPQAERIESLAESWHDSPTLAFLKAKAADARLAICATFIIKDADGHYLNRCVFVEPSGETTCYDKHHLFAPGGEAGNFTAGTQMPPVVRFRGWNIAFAICYDLRFPAWLRNSGSRYDVMILPASWPEKRAYAWHQLLIARAIENQSYVVGANRSGHDDFGSYENQTFIFDLAGKSAGNELSANEFKANDATKIIIADCSRDYLDDIRRKFPFLADADPFRFC